jgi:hypothetical protein
MYKKNHQIMGIHLKTGEYTQRRLWASTSPVLPRSRDEHCKAVREDWQG